MLSQSQAQEIADIAARLSRSKWKTTKKAAEQILAICAGDGIEPQKGD